MIRPVKIEDAHSISEIINYYIEETDVTFRENSLSLSDIEKKIVNTVEKYPWFVYEADGIIYGFAYAGSYRAVSGYKYTVETSIYVKPDIQVKGVGTALYTELLSDLKRNGYKVAVGVITANNAKSIQFHEKFNFKQVGFQERIGYKFNSWLDIYIYQINL